MALIAWISLLAAGVCFASSEPVIKSTLGTISGKSESFENEEVESFLGVPYAKAPVGELRFSLPQPFGPVGELNATQYSARCHQPNILKGPVYNQSEDCLYLNVFRKAGTQADSKKAVLVVIHGGAFSSGGADDAMYSGVPMAALGDVVVVTLNYRLGILGFADMKDLAPGNLGLHDQLMALEWVHNNIAAFGGDPKKVTLLGTSAGSMAIGALLITPLTRGKNFFKQVVMDGGVMSRTSITTQDYALNRVKEIAGKAGCAIEGETMLSCLRTANATQLTDLSFDPKISPIYTFAPTVDGKFLTVDPSKDVLENSDKFPDVRMIIGVTNQEGTIFASMYPAAKTLKTEAEFVALSEQISREFLFPFSFDQKEVKDALVETYFGKSADHFNDVAEFLADGSFKCPSEMFVKNFAKTHKNVFGYRFERIMKTQFPRFGVFDPELVGVFHSSPFLHFFGTGLAIPETVLKEPLAPEDKEFIMESVKALAEFVKTNEVPKLGGMTWPNYSNGEGVLVINDNSTTCTSFAKPERCHRVFSFLEKA